MSKKFFFSICAVVLSLSTTAQNANNAQWVNLYIGTGGHGHTNPAAIVPHGMIQPGPDTRHHGWDACAGYHYDDATINGFSQTHLSGTGCSDLSDFLIMPVTGKPDIKYIGDKELNQKVSFASPFNHSDEIIVPGYYAVNLLRYQIKTEITSTTRTAFYRFTYPNNESQSLIVDLDYNNQDQSLLEYSFNTEGDSVLNIFHRTQGWAYNQPIYAQLKFSKPFKIQTYIDTIKTTTKEFPICKLILSFDNKISKELLLKLGISFVDQEGALKNLAAETPSWDFDTYKLKAYQAWNNCLKSIDINKLGNAATDSTKHIFYTALYHSNIAPHIFSDVDGRYLGMDGNVYQSDSRDPIYTVFSLWDTHRALHPLISILEPNKNEAYIRSLIKKGEEGGIVPKWELYGNYTGCMIGYHFASLLADSYLKGNNDFNIQKALYQAIRASEYDTTGITKHLPRWKMEEMMPKARHYKNIFGYIPCDKARESVAKGLEYAYNDWCIAKIAKQLGRKKIYKAYSRRAKFYKNYFDRKTQFMRGKDIQGKWRTPFDPYSSDHRMDDYTEGNAWQWTWYVPHDPKGLKKLFGGKKKLLTKLDSLFFSETKLTGDNISPDISGLIGQYAHGNEPGHHTIHLYNYMGKPQFTQSLVDSVLYNLYFNQPNGLSGNEDCGQMSAWYIMNAAGFYQFCPGEPIYSIGRPIFEEITIHLPQKKQFVIKTINNSRQNKFIKSVSINGKQLKKPFFTHHQLIGGGTMEIEMSPTPTKWGK